MATPHPAAASYAAADGVTDLQTGMRMVRNVDFMGAVITVMVGDITAVPGIIVTTPSTDFRVNGTGVDARVHAVAGWKLRLELTLNWTGGEIGQAYQTGGWDMEPACPLILNAVGPDYGVAIQANDENVTAIMEEDLRRTYVAALQTLLDNGNEDWKVIVFPLISVGEYQFPPEKACEIALKTVRDWLRRPDSNNISRVIFVVPGDDASDSENIYADYVPSFFAVAPRAAGATPAAETPAVAPRAVARRTIARPAAARPTVIRSTVTPSVVETRTPCNAPLRTGARCPVTVTRTADGLPRWCPRHERAASPPPRTTALSEASRSPTPEPVAPATRSRAPSPTDGVPGVCGAIIPMDLPCAVVVIRNNGLPAFCPLHEEGAITQPSSPGNDQVVNTASPSDNGQIVSTPASPNDNQVIRSPSPSDNKQEPASDNGQVIQSPSPSNNGQAPASLDNGQVIQSPSPSPVPASLSSSDLAPPPRSSSSSSAAPPSTSSSSSRLSQRGRRRGGQRGRAKRAKRAKVVVPVAVSSNSSQTSDPYIPPPQSSGSEYIPSSQSSSSDSGSSDDSDPSRCGFQKEDGSRCMNRVVRERGRPRFCWRHKGAGSSGSSGSSASSPSWSIQSTHSSEGQSSEDSDSSDDVDHPRCGFEKRDGSGPCMSRVVRVAGRPAFCWRHVNGGKRK